MTEESLVDHILQTCNYNSSSEVTCSEERRLKNKIHLTFPQVSITKVKKLENKYLRAAFQLKKAEHPGYRVIELIHATAAANVQSIEKNNLDWRLVQRAKYGYGVAFSENADYANYHSSWSGGDDKAFIICDVLVQNISSVNDNKHIAPPSPYIDTFLSTNGYVYVKFEDFTFLPKFALYYSKPSDTSSKFCRWR